MAIATTFAQRGIEITYEKGREIIEEICARNPELRGQIEIDEMAEKIQTATSSVGRFAYNEETLARFLEIPIADLPTVRPENLDLGVLYNHVKLEGEFQQWFNEWGYEVENGCVLTGLRGVEYLADVYGCLRTLHGEFEICVNFVCDQPPDEDRVFALLGKIEAYAEAKKSFSHGDIFTIAAPHRFTQGSINAMTLQNEQENYSVFPLDGGDIYVLENARTPKDRLEELEDKVRQAQEETRRSKIRRGRSNEDIDM
jgi:hypothetical protein